jgi:hypothetical protein
MVNAILSASRDATVHVARPWTKTETASLLLIAPASTKEWNTMLAPNSSKEVVHKQKFGKGVLFYFKFEEESLLNFIDVQHCKLSLHLN